MRKRPRIFLSIIFLLLLFGLAMAQGELAPTQNPVSPPQQQKANSRPAVRPSPQQSTQAAPSDSPKPEPFDHATKTEMAAQCVTLETEIGKIVIEVLPETAPETVRNFLNLAATGAYDTTTFSRVVRGFVIQGGQLGTSQRWNEVLSQRARRTISDEPNFIRHERGIVSMARSERPNSATTSFFILVDRAPHLDGTFAAFGRVTSGMDVVD
ncbi:MAG TPA: peptidylprolyl isomerase, partial [Pyrinomonadaceae bacterium]|nr:peptidylprolyl isomerase [Pyrinomonadaceae bacterium]